METIVGVQQFMVAFGQEVREKPGIPAPEIYLLRGQLVGEETSELNHAFAARDVVEVLDALTDIQYVVDGTYLALGYNAKPARLFGVYDDHSPLPSIPSPMECSAYVSSLYRNLGEFLQHCCLNNLARAIYHLNELQLQTWRTFSACGLDRARLPAYREVQSSNMSKLGPDGRPILNEAGRVVKGPNYRPPDLVKVLSAVYPMSKEGSL